MPTFSTVTDFGGIPFQASAFPFAPYTIFDDNDNAIDGTEFTMAGAMASSLNMRMTVARPADGEWWGNPQPDGTHTGRF